MSNALSDQVRLAALAVNQASRTAVKLARQSPLSRWLAGVPTAYHLLILPQDLHTGDPSFMVELYEGYLGLAGATAAIGTESPFEVLPPTADWQEELHAFSWLRHLHAAEDDIARERARKFTADWIAYSKRRQTSSSSADATAKRVIAILSHAAFLLDGADPDFYDAVMRMLSRDVHDLTVLYVEGTGVSRLRALTAILLAGLCIAEHEAYLRNYTPTFCAEIERQILGDGAHVSRNSAALIQLLIDFLPLKQCFVARQIEPPEALYSALSRMLPMLRFLRLGDGSLAHFNGMGPTFLDHVATVLAYDDTGSTLDTIYSQPSGFARLAAGKTVIIADAGGPPPLGYSEKAGAGCAAFEMSVGHEVLITNCGAPPEVSSNWYVVSRSTAAHSTLTIEDLSSSKLIQTQPAGGRELFLLSGPKMVKAEVAQSDNAVGLQITHDGYRDRFGLLHRRRLTLRKNGLELDGQDQLLAGEGQEPLPGGAHFAIRFHLHPRVTADLARNTNAAILTTPSGNVWRFSAEGSEVDIEESLFFADPICLRRSFQIVLKGVSSRLTSISWRVEKVEEPRHAIFDGGKARSINI